MGSQSSSFNNDNQKYFVDERKYFTGDCDTHVSDGAEDELPNVSCWKNPGHTKFIPVDKFTLEHLPKGQRDNDLYELIKATADLTVKVNVYMTSPHRREFWPETNQLYPFYNMRELDVLRTGSGMIDVVERYKEGVDQYGRKKYSTCPCNRCLDFLSTLWWEFHVVTSAQVVFDDIEASHTTLRLFHDSKDSPLITVDKVSVVDVNVKNDRCILNCVTCDKILGDRLEKMWRHYYDVWKKVSDQYENPRSVDKLTFIVSHPHGCTKQVSVGHWIKKYKLGRRDRKFTYTACTCLGSSGARVHCVGYRDWWKGEFYHRFVHSGTNSKHKYNYSGVGM